MSSLIAHTVFCQDSLALARKDSLFKDLQLKLNQFIQDPIFRQASISFEAFDLNRDTIVVEHQSIKALSPASTTKLFSTATAFELLGKDYIPKTRIYSDGTLGKDSILIGNIWIRGGGDASIGSRYYNEENFESALLYKWADTLKKMGIKSIQGSIIADASEFGYSGVPNGWSWDDIGNYYGTGPSGLTIYDNAIKYVFKSGPKYGTKVSLLETIPVIPGLTFRHTITAGGKGDNSYLYGAPYSLERWGTGTISTKSNRFVVKGSAPDPEALFGLEVFRAFKRFGLNVSDSVQSGRALELQDANLRYSKMKLLLENPGRTVGSIAWWTNMKSVNLFAEQLLCLVGYNKNGEGTTESGLKALNEYWSSKIDLSGVSIKDGSGLSRSNAISAHHFCQLLNYMKKAGKQFDVFYSTLPVAGVSGTLSSVCKNQFAQGRLKAKSGTMKKIKSYAGYIETASGSLLSFALVVNNYDGSSEQVVNKMEVLFNALARL